MCHVVKGYLCNASQAKSVLPCAERSLVWTLAWHVYTALQPAAFALHSARYTGRFAGCALCKRRTVAHCCVHVQLLCSADFDIIQNSATLM